jgi:hypothetical protein
MEGVTKQAMDAAIAKAIAATTHARDEQHRAAREAERFVRPIVGELAIAYDSADEIYGAALKARGFNTEGMPPSAFRSILEQLPRHTVERRPEYGMDAVAQQSFDERYPGASRIRAA